MNVDFDKDGNPIIGLGSVVVVTQKMPGNSYKSVSPSTETTAAKNTQVANWGDSNDLPTIYQECIRKSTVLSSGIDYKVRIAAGQGVFACRVLGFEESGKEMVEVINNPEINKFLNSRMIRRYLMEAYRDYYGFGNVFPLFRMNANKQIAAINVIDAPYARISKDVKKVVSSGLWDGDKSDAKSFDLLDADNVIDIVESAKQKTAFVMLVNTATSGHKYYSLPPWEPARLAKWLDISMSVPDYLIHMFENQMSIKYHIRIPYAYWDKKYPKGEYKDVSERKLLIEKSLTALENSLTDTKNARKTIITHFDINTSGKAEEKFDIEVLDDKFTNDQYLPQSAVSNAEILVSLGINPVVKGLAMAAGPYANSSGGSNIREAYLIDVALAWMDRQEVLDPIELAIAINWPDEFAKGIELRTRNTLLTTLDTGAGTTKTIS